jgi:DNA-binding response OmpR family regulator
MIDAMRTGQTAAGARRWTDSERLVVGPLEVIADQLLVVADGAQLWLRPREMEVMAFLARHPATVLDRTTIFEAVWGRPLDPQDRSVDSQITRLRRELADVAPGWAFIHTHHRRGYRLEPQPRSGHLARRRSRGPGRHLLPTGENVEKPRLK